jgi:2-polyprenyl-3-methyl-5-hydroxy-6-metoxy-1,4-benzoquinol methylase
MATQVVDQAKLDAFMGKVLGDFAGATTALLCNLGDQLGLFKDLAARGPATSDELAQRTGLTERYVREWANGLFCAGYLEHDAASGRFTLPPEHAPALADEGGPGFFGAFYQFLPGWVEVLDGVVTAFQQGGGVPIDAYSQSFRDATERATAAWFDHLLLPVWLPGAPDVPAKLEAGGLLADVGSGHGRALITLARAFPTAHFVGYDVSEPSIAVARARAEAAGVADRVRFDVRDIGAGLPERYDVITTFDVVHDLPDPQGALRAIRAALKPDGIYLMLEFACADTVEGNAGPMGALGYTASLLYCMTTSLAASGAGLGSYGMPESRVRRMCAEAGFGAVRVVPSESPLNVLYEIRA